LGDRAAGLESSVEEMRAVLGNVEELKRDYPGFQAPPVEHREDLRPGDLAELMLLTDQYPESIWAEVEDVPGPGWYRGVLETGEPIEFGPEHVSDIKVPGPQMGAEKASVWDYFHPGREPKPPGRPSIWDTEARAAWAKEERARSSGQPKRSFWDWLRRRPKVELTPIPEEERRREKVRPGFLPAPEIREEAQVEPEVKVPEAPTIIVPEAPDIIGEPISYFDILGPEEPSPGGLIVVPETPEAPPSPGALVVREPVFGILEEQPAKPSGMIVPQEAGLAPAEGVYGVLEPKPMLPGVPGPYGIIEPPAFEVALPSSPFGILEPQGGMVVAEPVGIYDILEPKGGLTTYVSPEESPFGKFEAPPPSAPVEEEAPREKKKRKKKPPVMSIRSSVDDWKEWILRNFDLEVIWKHIRDSREDDWYKHQHAHEEDSGIWATIPIHTWNAGEWYQMGHSLDLPDVEIEPYVLAMDKEAEEEGGWGSEYERFHDSVLQPVSDHIEEAFRSMQPSDIRGQIFLGEDGLTEGQTYGLVYYEPMAEKEREAILREEELEEEQKRAEYKERERGKKDLEKRRQKDLRAIWGRVPTVQELVLWAKQMYGTDFWNGIKKNRKSRGFQEEVKEMAEQGEVGVMEVEKIAEENPELYGRLSAYFGIPTEIFDVYFKSGPFEQAQKDLWDEVLMPYLEAAGEAVTSLKPKGIPGIMEFGWDDSEVEFYLKYLEEGEET
jgi:hypothetical protein